jgi:hypothetical protein
VPSFLKKAELNTLLPIKRIIISSKFCIAYYNQCCGSMIRCLFYPGIRDGKKSRSGSGMNIPILFSELLETIFWVKMLKFFDEDPEIFLTLDPGWKKFRPGIIPDPQH